MTDKYKVLKVKTDNQDIALIKKGNKYLCLEISKVQNDKWITVKPHGQEEKGRHLKLEGDETPKEAMKRQWGVDVDKKKEKTTAPERRAITPEKKLYEYKEAQNKKEAEDFARNTLKIQNVNYGKLETSYCNEINNAMSDNFNSFPNVKNVVNSLGSIQGINKDRQLKLLEDKKEEINSAIEKALERTKMFYTEQYIEHYMGGEEGLREKVKKEVIKRYKSAITTKATSSELAHYTSSNDVGRNGIYFNEKFSKRIEVEALMDIASESGFHPKGAGTAKGAIDHEFGHAIERYILNERNNGKSSPSYRKIQNMYNDLSRQEISDGLSRYAVGSLSEFIAEAYSEYKNSSNPREISRNVGEWLKQAYMEVQ